MNPKSLFICLLMLATFVSAKDPDDLSSPGKVNGCLGMKWGTTIDEAKSAIVKRGDMELSGESHGDLARLQYDHGMLAGLPINYVILSFYKNAFFEAYVQFSDGSTLQFVPLMEALNKKYGTAKSKSVDSAIWGMMDAAITLQTVKNDQTGERALSLDYVNSGMLKNIPYSARQKNPAITGKGL